MNKLTTTVVLVFLCKSLFCSMKENPHQHIQKWSLCNKCGYCIQPCLFYQFLELDSTQLSCQYVKKKKSQMREVQQKNLTTQDISKNDHWMEKKNWWFTIHESHCVVICICYLKDIAKCCIKKYLTLPFFFFTFKMIWFF